MTLSWDSFTPNKVMSKTTMSALAFIQVVIAVAFWQLGTSPIVPKPLEVLGSFSTVWENGFGQEFIVSFWLCLEAIFFTSVISLSLSYLTVLPFFRPIATFITKGRFLSLVGFSFLFVLITSSGHQLKLFMIVFGMSVFFVTSMVSVIQAIPKADFDYARTLRMSEWRVVWEVVVRGTMSTALEIVQQIFAIGFIMLPTVEGLSRAEGGVGKFLLDSNKHFALADIFAIQIQMFMMGLFLDYCIGALNKIVCSYAFLNRERQ
jgi:NitT/TauT family transport system permease protein